MKAVQLRITFGGHWANVTEIEGGAFTVERERKKLAITPYIRDEGKVELQTGVPIITFSSTLISVEDSAVPPFNTNLIPEDHADPATHVACAGMN